MFIRVLWWLSIGMTLWALLVFERLVIPSPPDQSCGECWFVVKLQFALVVIPLSLVVSLAFDPVMRARPAERLLGLLFIPLGAADFAFLFLILPAFSRYSFGA